VARLSPDRAASTIATSSGAPRDSARRLVVAIKQVLTEAIERQSSPAYREDRFPGLRPRGGTLPPRPLRRHDQAPHPGRTIDILLSRHASAEPFTAARTPSSPRGAASCGNPGRKCGIPALGYFAA
jgi:hypothetical protein